MADAGTVTRAQPAPERAVDAPTRASRLRFWRSPADQPRWARPALLAVAALAAVVYGWQVRHAGYAEYYAVAVRSMSVSWRAFLFGAFDPGATVTVDKLTGAFLPQALSARVFGFHPWSLALPQVVEGVVSVLVLYRLVRRWCGAPAGLLAAAMFALTPIVASMFGHPMEDAALTLCLVLAADAFVAALAGARTGRLVLAGVWVGLGFQAKMLQSWLVLPAFALTWLAFAPASWRRRLGQVALAGAATVAVSLAWVLLLTVVPAGDRPYVDGTTNDSAVAMVFGYNGLDRFGAHVPGTVESGFTTPDPAGPADAAASPAGSWHKLVDPGYATQIGWLHPLALAGLVVGLLRGRRAGRTDPVRAGFVLWGGWLATAVVVFSGMTLTHRAYLATLAPPLAALAAAGVVLSWRALRDRWATWLLPAVLLVQLAWTAHLAGRYAGFLPWLTWPALATAAAATAALVVVGRRPGRPGRATGALVGAGRRTERPWRAVAALGVAAVLAVPAAWGLSVLDRRYAGTAFEAGAGPSGPVGLALDADTTDTLTEPRRRLDDYLLAHRDGARYVAATSSWRTASQFVLPTGQPFLPLGGYSGLVPQPTLAGLRALVDAGELRFVLLGGVGGLGTTDSELSRIMTWVLSSCREVPAAEHGGGDELLVYRCGPGS
ncbi:glycosyltransferase family 39 protein [Micromonospora chersina]|uniref:ArnT family glycosyltransferase n=1 Tax=Micromonospora chersina TaxID=47854 RepID=UPI003453DFFA